MLATLAAMGWSNALQQGELAEYHREMIEGTGPAPLQYRAMTPWLAEGLYRLLARGPIHESYDRLIFSYIGVHAAAFAVTGVFFIAFCRRWLSLEGSLLSFSLLAGIGALSNRTGCVCVSDPINLMFVVAGLWAIQKDRIWALLLIVAVGAVNRESILILLGYYVLIEWPKPKATLARNAALLVAVWGISYGAMRWGYGMRPYYCDVVMVDYNFGGFRRWAPPLVLLVPLFVAAFQQPVGKWPADLRRALLLLIPYIILHTVIARLNELRLFLPLFPILVPLAVHGIVNMGRGNATEE